MAWAWTPVFQSKQTCEGCAPKYRSRTQAYNAGPGKPLFIGTLRVFGSYLSPDVDPLGDVDIELTYGRRITAQTALAGYTKASGRSFGTYFDQLMWPQTELVWHLKKRSASINITLEDITRITDTFDTIYSIDDDPGTVSPPADRTLVGR